MVAEQGLDAPRFRRIVDRRRRAVRVDVIDRRRLDARLLSAILIERTAPWASSGWPVR